MLNVRTYKRALIDSYRLSLGFSRWHIPTALMLLLAFYSTSTTTLACACGCGVFDVDNLFQTQPGGSLFLEYDYVDQNKNWS